MPGWYHFQLQNQGITLLKQTDFQVVQRFQVKQIELKLPNMLHITIAACHVLYNVINIQKRCSLFQRSQAKIFLMTSVSRDMLNWDLDQWQKEECEGQIVQQKSHAGNFKAKIKSSHQTPQFGNQEKQKLHFSSLFLQRFLFSPRDVWENQC